jgi:transglutaminase-like putative cysteine protease
MADEAEVDADALRGLVVFQDPATLLIGRIEAEARVGAPLKEQPEMLSSLDRLLDLLGLVLRHLGSTEAALALPLVLDQGGSLQRGLHLAASPQEIQLVQGLEGLPPLAHPSWSVAVARIDEGLAPKLPARRLLAALASSCREERLSTEHPILGDSDRRELLYDWLVERSEEIASDREAVGVLGRARLIPNADGLLRAPRDLLLDPTLPDLGLGWGVSSEVPAPLISRLRQLYQLDEERLSGIIDHVIEGHGRAAAEGNLARSGELLTFLAQALSSQTRGNDLTDLARRHRLHRRLKVASDLGEYLRPGKLMLPSEESWKLIERFLLSPPPRVEPAYDDEPVRRLLLAAGARPDLTPEELGRLHPAGEGLRTGREARLAFARYLAVRALSEPSLRDSLQLDRTAWVPDGLGALRRPDELFWPGEAVTEILGRQPALMPDPELFHTVPPQLGSWLSFRGDEDIALTEVAARLDRLDRPAPAPILEWMERGLGTKRLKGAEVRSVLAEMACLEDDRGRLRRPGELVRLEDRPLFGRRRGSWNEALRYPRLASVLGISKKVRVAQILDFLDEITGELGERGGRELVADEPELAAAITRCLGELASDRGHELPDRLPVTCSSGRGIELVVLPDPEVSLPEPPSLAEAAARLGLRVRFPIMPDGAEVEAMRYLARLGVRSLWSGWWLRAVEPGHDLTAEYRRQVERLSETLSALLSLLATSSLRPGLGTLPARLTVRVVESLALRGTLDGYEIEIAVGCALSEDRRELLITPEVFWDRAEIAEVVRRGLLRAFDAPGELVALLTELLEVESTPRMEALLRERGLLAEAPKPKRATTHHLGGEGGSPSPSRDASRQRLDDEKELSALARTDELEEKEPGLLDRVKRWWRGEDEEAPADRPKADIREAKRRIGKEPPAPRPRRPGSSGRRKADTDGNALGLDGRSGAPRHEEWFKRRDSIESQLHGARSWLEDRGRPPQFGLSFAPYPLPLPWTYAVQLLTPRFDRHSQSWQPDELDPTWCASATKGRDLVTLRGRVPQGEVVLPLPLYGRVVELEASPKARRIVKGDGTTLLLTQEQTDLSYTVALDRPPSFDAVEDELEIDIPRALLEPTVPDRDLPTEVHSFIFEAGASDLAPMERALEVRRFIRESYRYDPSYLEDDGIARWLRNLSFGRANVHIAALHAGRDGRHLGRGVCYELNALACELLRRLGVPAAVATGWTMSDGSLAEPDHLWGMALLPTPEGPRWYPIDAASTREGRPLRLPSRPPGPWRVTPPRRKLRGDEPPKAKGRSRRVDGVVPMPEGVSVRRRGKVKRARQLPVAELVRVLQHFEVTAGLAPSSPGDLYRLALSIMGDPEKIKALLDLADRQRPKAEG